MPNNSNKKNKLQETGFSLIELIISLAIISSLLLGVYNLILFTIRLNSDNQNYVIAMNLANQKMEYIRNLPYDDVGTIAGSPAGIIPENTSEGIFNIHITVMFYDDPYDGTMASGTDSIFVDYKIATVEVSWQGRFAPKNVTVFSKVIPNTEETLSGYGLLKLLVVNSNGSPVSGADVHIENSSPLLNATYSTDSEGILRIPLLPDLEGYEVTVSKPGFSIDKTYDRDATNLNPTKPHISIFDGVKTEESFAIDALGVLNIRTVSNNLPDNWQVNTEIGSTTDTLVKFDIDASDNLYFAWQSKKSTSTSINIQKFDSSLNKQYPSNKTISTTKHQNAPDIAVTNSGNSFVVWQDNSSVLKLIAQKKQTQKFANLKPKLPNYAIISDFTLLNKFSSVEILDNSYNFLNNFKNIFPQKTNNFVLNLKNNFKIFAANAQSSASIVQSTISPNVNYSSIMSANLSSTPSVGNILVAIAVLRNDWTDFNDPFNTNGVFTKAVYSDSMDEYLDIGIWYKVVEASEPTQTVITATQNIRGGVLILLELSGIDINNIVDTITSNNQTTSNSTIADTGDSTATADNAFAIAAVSFADNNFNIPNSSNWSSISSDLWTQELWEAWSTGRDGSLGIASMIINTSSSQKATLSLAGATGEERNSCLVSFNLTPTDNATLSSIATQTATMIIPSSNNYLGGAFTLTENNAFRNITSIAINENGSIDAQNSISNFRLFYDLDTTAPYDCASENFDILSDAQFGTSTNFNSSDGEAVLSEPTGIQITTTKSMCIYPVFDITDNAQKQETIEIYISNPSSMVLADSGTIIPASAILIASTTVLLKPAEINQANFRWRNDNGDEESASWEGGENIPISISKNNLIRLRFGVYNSGSLDTGLINYQLEYGQLLSTCENISTWNSLPNDTSLHWQIIDSLNIVDGATTSNVLAGLTDMNIDFIPGYIKDADALTSAINLSNTDFTEIEYSIQATSNALDENYCFRLTNNGSTTNFVYSNYAKATIVGDENIYIIGLDSLGNENWAIKKVNSDLSDFDQISPRIALSENFGSATSCIVWEDYRNNQADIYAQSFDANGNKLWTNDLQITSSSSDEVSPVIAIDSQDNIYITWTNQDSLSKNIYLQKIDFLGNIALSNPLKITASSSDDYEIDLTLGSNNNIYLSWTSEYLGLKNVYLAKYSSTTQNLLWSKKINKDSSSDDRFSSSLAVGNSYIYASWTDFREGNNDIYTQKFDKSGNALWTSDQKINVNLTSTDQSISQLIINSSSDPIAVWQDNRNNNYDIFATVFNNPGATIGVGNVPLIISGTKKIGENPVILKFQDYYTSDSNGDIAITAEWDVPGYSMEINSASSSLSIIMTNPIQPIEFLAGETKNILIYVE